MMAVTDRLEFKQVEFNDLSSAQKVVILFNDMIKRGETSQKEPRPSTR